MANALTGDHDAVLQVSGSTLNRLLATMHQNEGTGTTLPTLPHSAYIRIGDDPATRVDGVQGSARIQISVPVLQFVDGAHDRLYVNALLRTRFTADSGSAPFPEFTYGRLFAEFRITESQVAQPQGPPQSELTFDAVRDVVSFTSGSPDDAAITRQIVPLLRTTFRMPAGMPVVDGFVNRNLRCLVRPPNGTAVVAGLGLGGPAGLTFQQPNNVNDVLLGGRDVALAVSREFIVSLVQSQLTALLTQPIPSITVTVPLPWPIGDVSTVYRPRITSATATWMTTVSSPFGGIKISIAGEARTDSVAPDVTFQIEDVILLEFVAGSQSLSVTPSGNPTVTVDVSGVWAAVKTYIRNRVEPVVRDIYQQQLTAALRASRDALGMVGVGRSRLVRQLRTLDDQADARFTDAEFGPDGLVLRGIITVAPRRAPSVSWDTLRDGSGYGAFLSWYPGGHIITFYWYWRWFGLGPGQSDEHMDKFVLRTGGPLPGLPTAAGPLGAHPGDGYLSTEGFVIDAVTGEARRDIHGDQHISFYPLVNLPPDDGGPGGWLTPLLRLGADSDSMLVEVGRGGGRGKVNTLLWHAGTVREPAHRTALADAVEQVQSEDTGLLVVALLPDGELTERGPEIAARLRPTTMPCLVNEDVGGGWARALGIGAERTDEALRLVSPDGEVVWSHDGPIDADQLTRALREHLVASGPVTLRSAAPDVVIGRRAPHVYLEPVSGQVLPLSRLRGRRVELCFLLPWAESSIAAARRADGRTEHGVGVVVLTGADAEQAAEFAAGCAPSSLLVVPDPHRRVTIEYGVAAWPTTVVIDESGVVASTSNGHPAVPGDADASGSRRPDPFGDDVSGPGVQAFVDAFEAAARGAGPVRPGADTPMTAG